MTPPVLDFRLKNTVRLVASRYPSVGILDVVASPEDLDAVIELEAWTNDRISTELGILHRLAKQEWVMGVPMASVIMASFCHPRPGGGRFNSGDRGAWYAALTLSTAHAEVIYHRGREFAEVGLGAGVAQVRAYLADFSAGFHDLRALTGAIYSPDNYTASQSLARELFEHGSNGVVYRSVRDARGTCIACFRPKLVRNVRVAAHYEYRWSEHSTGRRVTIRKLDGPAKRPS